MLSKKIYVVKVGKRGGIGKRWGGKNRSRKENNKRKTRLQGAFGQMLILKILVNGGYLMQVIGEGFRHWFYGYYFSTYFRGTAPQCSPKIQVGSKIII